MKVTSKERAWKEANKIFPTDYQKDDILSERAGYAIYRHQTLNPEDVIRDLGDRLEVTVNGKDTRIWIEKSIPITYRALVTYKVQSGKILTKELEKVTKIENVYQYIFDKPDQIFRVYLDKNNFFNWTAGSIIQVTMIPE